MRRCRLTALFLSVLAVSILSAQLAAALEIPERRKEQFRTDSGYYVFPTPYSIPGIGYGYALAAVVMNAGGSYADFAGIAVGGDVEGFGVGGRDLHLMTRRLILDMGYASYSKASVTSYSSRGMNAGSDDFAYLDFSGITSYGGRLTATFLDRRLEFYGYHYRGGSTLERVRDSDGDVVIDIDDPDERRFRTSALGMLIDLTDDYSDPRRGVRLDVGGAWSPRTETGADFYVLSLNASVYVPLGSRNTWVFNYYRAGAIVKEKGETDRDVIMSREGLDCPTVTDPELRLRCEQVVDTIIAANTYGTVGSLGGTSRLRSYPEGRYTGAQAQFFGTEFRWNITEEFTPFNIYIMKDIRTSFQVAFFYEIGSVADRESDLNTHFRSSYGVGFRLVTASGFVLRADTAAGDEGLEITIIFGYPWEF